MAESEDIFGSQTIDENFLENLIKESENGQQFEENRQQMETMEAEPTTTEKITHKNKLTELPLSRIRSIMKMDPDVHIASQEAVYLVTKATELFLGSIAKETYRHTAKAKRKTVQRRDIDAAIENLDSLCFLEGALD